MASDPLFTLSPCGICQSEFQGYVPVDIYNRMEQAYRGEVTPRDPFIVQHERGRVAYDLLCVSLLPVISERVVELMTLAKITGWRGYPVQVLGEDGEPLATHRTGLSITGRCRETRLDKSHSELIYEELPTGRFPRYRGLFVSLDSWDGSDLFLGENGTGHILATEKVRELFFKAQITNVTFIPIDEVQVIAMDQPRYTRSEPA